MDGYFRNCFGHNQTSSFTLKVKSSNIAESDPVNLVSPRTPQNTIAVKSTKEYHFVDICQVPSFYQQELEIRQIFFFASRVMFPTMIWKWLFGENSWLIKEWKRSCIRLNTNHKNTLGLGHLKIAGFIQFVVAFSVRMVKSHVGEEIWQQPTEFSEGVLDVCRARHIIRADMSIFLIGVST